MPYSLSIDHLLPMKSALKYGRQPGAFLMARPLLMVGVLMALLVIPLWLKKEQGDQSKAAKKAKDTSPTAPVRAAATTPAAAAAGSATPGTRPIGFGLTFAMAAADGKMPSDVAGFGCHGEPAPLDQPHQGSCNPPKGDTSCRVVLPVLCLKPGDLAQPSGANSETYGWSGATFSATQPVMGAILESEAIANARCEKELGTGWRMAEFHEGKGGLGLMGLRGTALGQATRYWVHVNDQPGNCWNSAP